MAYQRTNLPMETQVISIISKPMEMWADTWYRRAQLRLYLKEKKYPKYDTSKKNLVTKFLRNMEDDAYEMRQTLWAGIKFSFPVLNYSDFLKIHEKEVKKYKNKIIQDLKDNGLIPKDLIL